MSYQIITQSNLLDLTNSPNTTFAIREQIDLNNNTLTIASNCNLKFEGGSFINCSLITGNNTHIDADLNQIFKGNFSFSGSWSTKKTYPQWFGVAGNNVTNDQASIEAMIGFISNLNGYKEFYIPQDLICKINGSLDLSGIENINIKGQIVLENSIVNPNVNQIASITEEIKIGTTSKGSKPLNVFISRVQGCIIVISGTVHSNITINSAPKLRLYGDGETYYENVNQDKIYTKYSIAYNKFYLSDVKVLLIECSQSLELNSDGTPVTPGWVNENKFFGGNIKKLSIEGTYPCNNNIFYGTMFEDFTGDFQKGYSNYFYDVRFEGNLDLNFTKDVYDTRFYKTYHPYTPEFLKKRDFRLNTSPPTPPIENVIYNINDKGELNGIIHHTDIIFKDKVIFEMNKNTGNFDTSIFSVDGDNLKVIASNYTEFFDTGKFKLPQYYYDTENKIPQPIAVKLFSDVDFADARLRLYDINGDLIDQSYFDNSPSISPNDLVNLPNMQGSWKNNPNGPSNPYSYDTWNWYQFVGNLTKSSSGKAIFPIFPKNVVHYAQLIIRIGANSASTVFNNFSIVLSESKEYNTVVGQVPPQEI